ncbi:hypothetical protein LCGC14_0702060 [marine sediment metagenome]|uniref:Uncharacterized protein n=1 Tax=marine sediment metagenome TaxID=412755 RepID=A0A0F9QM82_9ZZZZ
MSDTKYIYVRDEAPVVLDKNGEPKKDDDGNLVASRGFPVGCFAYRAIPARKNGREIGVILRYGYSVFNPNDKFDRNDARVIAEYRLITNCRAVYVASTYLNANDLLAKVLSKTYFTEIHQWAESIAGKRVPLSMRFREACKRMAKSLLTESVVSHCSAFKKEVA